MISPIQTSSDKENSGPFGFVCEYCVHANLPFLPNTPHAALGACLVHVAFRFFRVF